MFSIALTLVIFVIFLILGYLSQKRSGGFFLILAGFSLMTVAASSSSLLGSVVVGLLVIFGVFIVFQGGLKAFYHHDAKPETGGRMKT